ncbi:MAG: PspA/IM30 family protein [Gammaproteobacteria bacterium]|nr:PspA/IM30 family protein [Gammaproteobacteria bacterium]
MALMTRITRLFRADLNAVLDQIEEPEALLRQAIREMEDDLALGEQRIRAATQEQAELTARKQELEQSLPELEGELELCFASEKEDLAKSLVRRKLEVRRLVKHLDARARAAGQYVGEQRKLLEEHRLTLEGLRQKAEIFCRRPQDPVAGSGASDAFARDLAVSDDEVEIAFLREQSKRRGS